MADTKHVIGITELTREFRKVGAEFHKDKDIQLRILARPVANDAERLGVANDVGFEWSRMRVASTARIVYVAPVKRGTRVRFRKRRNFPRFLLGRAMEPALEANRSRILHGIDELVARMARKFNRG